MPSCVLWAAPPESVDGVVVAGPTRWPLPSLGAPFMLTFRLLSPAFLHYCQMRPRPPRMPRQLQGDLVALHISQSSVPVVSTLSCGENLGPAPALTSGCISCRKYDKRTLVVLSFGAIPKKIEKKKADSAWHAQLYVFWGSNTSRHVQNHHWSQ